MKKRVWFILSIVLLSLIGFGVVQSRTPNENDLKRDGQKVDAAAKDILSSPGGNEDSKKTLPTVRVEVVTSQPLAKNVTLTGEVTPTRTARLASPGEGPVEPCAIASCMVREGDEVEKGQVLLRISRNKAARAQLAAAAQALKEKETELQRIAQLVQGGAIPGSELDGARSAHENARAQYAKAMESTEDYSLTAPWNGIVAKVYVTEGDYVAPRTPLIEIFDPASLVVRSAIPETISTEVREDMPVEVQLDAYPGTLFQGTLSRIFPQLDEHTHTRTVEVTLIDPVDLIPGMFARIEVVLARISDAITVPDNCLVATPEGGFTAFVVEDGKAVRRKLDTGMEINGRVQILSGLRTGDRLVVAGLEKLKDGAVVKVLEPTPLSPEAAESAGRS